MNAPDKQKPIDPDTRVTCMPCNGTGEIYDGGRYRCRDCGGSGETTILALTWVAEPAL